MSHLSSTSAYNMNVARNDLFTRFGPVLFRPHLDNNFDFFFLFINLYHYGMIGQ